MKKVILSLVLAMASAAGYAQGVIGKWVTEGGDSQVEIYQNGDKLNGKIVWLKKGDGQLDVHNPDKKLQSRKLIGVNILTGLTKKGDKYEGGERQDLQVLHVARRRPAEGARLCSHVLRDADLDQKIKFSITIQFAGSQSTLSS